MLIFKQQSLTASRIAAIETLKVLTLHTQFSPLQSFDGGYPGENIDAQISAVEICQHPAHFEKCTNLLLYLLRNKVGNPFQEIQIIVAVLNPEIMPISARSLLCKAGMSVEDVQWKVLGEEYWDFP